MNPVVQRYLPPALVLAAAVFFGWPPSTPLDLGDDLVRVKSVRWRPKDLTDPPLVASSRNPFEELVVAIQEPDTAELDVIPIRPTGPTAETLKAGLKLDGIAKVGGRTWAVLNGRPRLEGDVVYTDDTNRHRCEIVSVEADHIVVRCEETITKLRPHEATTAKPSERTRS